jgi:hypothetical protein
VEQAVAKGDPDKQALACYGLLLPELAEVWRASSTAARSAQ